MTKRIELLLPAFKDYIWGGDRLNTRYHKNSGLVRTAESWELSAHPDGECRMADGPFAGLTLSQYIEAAGKEVLGKNAAAFADFPVLIKLIDAKTPLSVQVHPDDDYARRVEHGSGKTEMWYIVDCDEGAFLYFGFRKEVTKEEFAHRIADQTLTEILNAVPVHKGDVFFITAGTLHAIGAGILICEIQQNSNTTYRVYDYGRLGDDGKPRALHVEKALDVTKLTPAENSAAGDYTAISGGKKRVLASCPFFTGKEYVLDGQISLQVDDSSFISLLLTEGTCTVSGENSISLCPGQSVFVPADCGSIKLIGHGTLVATSI